MNAIDLKVIGQFGIISSNEKLVNVSYIRNFTDQVSGFGNVIKEFSWSEDGDTWSYWTQLTQDNLLLLSERNLLPESGFYIKFKYTLSSAGHVKIDDISIDIEYKNSDKNAGYVPFGWRIGHFGDVTYGSMRGEILTQCEPSFNPYLVNPAIDFYKDLCLSVNTMFGHEVLYMRAKPKANSGDVVFKEWTLYDVEEQVCTKIMVPNNEFPEATLNYNPYGIDYEIPFEVHIIKESFERTFGHDAAPQSGDIIYFPIMPTRLYEVKSSDLARDFMLQATYWKVDLMQYKSRANTYKSNKINDIIDELTTDQYEQFAEELNKDIKDITKPQQYNRNLGGGHVDPLRKYLNKDLKIYSSQIKNYGTVISQYHYDLSSITNPQKYNLATQYGVRSNFKKDDNFAYSCWFKSVNPKYKIHEDPVKIVSVINNIVKVEIRANRNYIIGNYIQIARQGKLNFYGKISSILNNQTYELEVPEEVLEYMDKVNPSWRNATGWYARLTFENILIDSLAESDLSVKGWRISIFVDRYIYININNEISYFILSENLTNDWTGLFFNYSAKFAQMNLTLWKIDETTKSTDLKLIYNKKIDNIISMDKDINVEYNLLSSNILLTNLRIFNETVEVEKQSTILNQNIVVDANHLILADNALPNTNLPYTGEMK